VDGIDEVLETVVEIKCGRTAYEIASESGRVPDYYYGQLQHILAVTGFASVDFWCYQPGLPELLIPVKRDEPYIKRLVELESEFWGQVVQCRQ